MNGVPDTIHPPIPSLSLRAVRRTTALLAALLAAGSAQAALTGVTLTRAFNADPPDCSSVSIVNDLAGSCSSPPMHNHGQCNY